jgi:integrase
LVPDPPASYSSDTEADSRTVGTGVRINAAAGLHVEDIDFDHNVVYIRRQVRHGKEYDTKTENGERIIDIDPSLSQVLCAYLAGRTSGRVFQARNGSPISDNNLRRRKLQPLLGKLGIPKGGFHAYRAFPRDAVTEARHAGRSANTMDRPLVPADDRSLLPYR